MIGRVVGRMAKDRIKERVVTRVKENAPLAAAIIAGARNAAERADTAMKPADVAKVADEVQKAIATKAPEQANAEPWWQNRVKIGSYVVGAGMALKLLNIDTGLEEKDYDTITSLIVIFGGGLIAAGEWFADRLRAIRWSSPWTIGVATVSIIVLGVTIWLASSN